MKDYTITFKNDQDCLDAALRAGYEETIDGEPNEGPPEEYLKRKQIAAYKAEAKKAGRKELEIQALRDLDDQVNALEIT